MSKYRKLKMGDIEPDAVCYKNGVKANTVAHRQRKDGKPEFTIAELKHIVLCWNEYDVLVESLKERTGERDNACSVVKTRTEQRDALLAACKAIMKKQNDDSIFRLPSNCSEIKQLQTAIATTKGSGRV